MSWFEILPFVLDRSTFSVFLKISFTSNRDQSLRCYSIFIKHNKTCVLSKPPKKCLLCYQDLITTSTSRNGRWEYFQSQNSYFQNYCYWTRFNEHLQGYWYYRSTEFALNLTKIPFQNSKKWLVPSNVFKNIKQMGFTGLQMDSEIVSLNILQSILEKPAPLGLVNSTCLKLFWNLDPEKVTQIKLLQTASARFSARPETIANMFCVLGDKSPFLPDKGVPSEPQLCIITASEQQGSSTLLCEPTVDANKHAK